MPTYEFICTNCGSTFEVKRPISQANEPVACPKCQDSRTKRKLTAIYCKGSHASNSGGCSSCSGGSCSSCGH